MTAKHFLVDVDTCSGCDLCIVACKDEHVGSDRLPWTRAQPDTGHFWVRVESLERGRIPTVRVTHLPVFCQHCANAACEKACTEHAIKRRDDGLVWIDTSRCTGCALCQAACPYGVIYMNAELGVAQKCSGCAHLVDEGALPRCVEICPHDAIAFGEEPAVPFRGAREELEVYHPEYHADPRVHWRNLPKPWIAGSVVDAVSDEVVGGATVRVLDLFDDGSLSVQSDEFGDFWLERLESHRKYRLEIFKDGYQRHVSVVTTAGDQSLGTVLLKRSS